MEAVRLGQVRGGERRALGGSGPDLEGVGPSEAGRAGWPEVAGSAAGRHHPGGRPPPLGHGGRGCEAVEGREEGGGGERRRVHPGPGRDGGADRELAPRALLGRGPGSGPGHGREHHLAGRAAGVHRPTGAGLGGQPDAAAPAAAPGLPGIPRAEGHQHVRGGAVLAGGRLRGWGGPSLGATVDLLGSGRAAGQSWPPGGGRGRGGPGDQAKEAGWPPGGWAAGGKAAAEEALAGGDSERGPDADRLLAGNGPLAGRERRGGEG
eukprot:11188142-Lingulodinium_polyedra.AAC.1